MTPTAQMVGDPASVTSEWDALADRTGARPWLRPGWVLAWQRAFGGRRGRLELACVREGARMRAVLPLVRTGATVATPANSETPFFGALADDEDDLEMLAGFLVESRYRRVTLWPFEKDDALDVLVAASTQRGYACLARSTGRSPFVPVHDDWDAYRATLRSKMLSDARRRRRRLEERGEVRFEIEDGTRDLGRRLGEVFSVEAAGWKGRKGTAIANRAPARAFYEDVCAWASQRGILRLAFLRFEGRAVAFDLSFEEGGVHYLLKTSFDPQFATYGPGVLIRLEMIKRAFVEGLD
ncbi:MAG TPA: GNAT family N-acetyltransferase, partial [Actinomycetota bacterium]